MAITDLTADNKSGEENVINFNLTGRLGKQAIVRYRPAQGEEIRRRRTNLAS